MLQQFLFCLPNELSGFVFNFDGTQVKDQQGLFDAFGKGMDAPNGYFGTNWNAFEDSLMDLQWLPERQVILVHEHLPDLTDGEIRVYLDILGSASLKWNSGKTKELQKKFPQFIVHNLVVYFRRNLQDRVSSIIA
jgi:hypothetical protein